MYIYKYVNKPFYKYWSGDTATRTSQYKNFLVNLLKEKGVERVLDAACGTGVDSIMLIEQVLCRIVQYVLDAACGTGVDSLMLIEQVLVE